MDARQRGQLIVKGGAVKKKAEARRIPKASSLGKW